MIRGGGGGCVGFPPHIWGNIRRIGQGLCHRCDEGTVGVRNDCRLRLRERGRVAQRWRWSGGRGPHFGKLLGNQAVRRRYCRLRWNYDARSVRRRARRAIRRRRQSFGRRRHDCLRNLNGRGLRDRHCRRGRVRHVDLRRERRRHVRRDDIGAGRRGRELGANLMRCGEHGHKKDGKCPSHASTVTDHEPLDKRPRCKPGAA